MKARKSKIDEDWGFGGHSLKCEFLAEQRDVTYTKGSYEASSLDYID